MVKAEFDFLVFYEREAFPKTFLLGIVQIPPPQAILAIFSLLDMCQNKFTQQFGRLFQKCQNQFGQREPHQIWAMPKTVFILWQGCFKVGLEERNSEFSFKTLNIGDLSCPPSRRL